MVPVESQRSSEQTGCPSTESHFLLRDISSVVQADIAVLVKMEVTMKRPAHGLLNRMLRLVEVDHEDMLVHGNARRVLSLESGAEYHIGLQILKSPHLDSGTECAADWLSISMPGCLPLRFQVNTV